MGAINDIKKIYIYRIQGVYVNFEVGFVFVRKMSYFDFVEIQCRMSLVALDELTSKLLLASQFPYATFIPSGHEMLTGL